MKRARTIRVAVGLAAAVAAISVPTAAEAATVYKSINGVVSYDGEPGESNDLTVTEVNGVIVFEEASIPITPHPSCAAGTPTKVACTAASVDLIRVTVGDGANKVVASAPFATTIDGGTGATNQFTGGPSGNVIIGGSGHDALVGGGGQDEIRGNGGPDYIDGRSGADQLEGGVGADGFVSGALDGADVMDGGPDFDIANYSGRATAVTVSLDNNSNDGGFTTTPILLQEQDNVRSTVEAVRGGSGNDSLTGSGAGNELYGEGGVDLLAGGLGADLFQGGPGEDTVSYVGYAGALTVDLDGEAGDDGVAGENDTAGADIERIIGGSGADTLTGNAAANLIRGGAGADLIDGLAGPDQLFGEIGDDTLQSDDGAADTDDCGADTDTTVSDALDTRIACELPVPAPPPAPPVGGGAPAVGAATGGATTTRSSPTQPGQPVGPLVNIHPSRLRLDRRGHAHLRVSCPASARQRCTGTLRLTRRVRGRPRVDGSRGFSVAAGHTAAVKVQVARGLRRSLRRGKPIRVRATATTRDAVSATRESQRTLVLQPFGDGSK